MRQRHGLRLLLTATPGWIWPAVAISLVWLGIVLHLATEQKNALADARQNGTNLARTFRESMVRTIREIDQTLLFIRTLHTSEGAALNLRPWVDGAGADQRLALKITMLDRNGLVTLDSPGPVPGRMDLSDSPHFRHFADQPPGAAARDHLYISPPVLGRVSNTWTIQFVRMLTTPDGAFDGIVVLSVPPADLKQVYRAVDVGRRGTVTLMDLDGTVLAHAGPGQSRIGAPSANPALDAPTPGSPALADAAEGSFEWLDPADDTRRIESFARIPGYPMVVSVGLARAEVLEPLDHTYQTLVGSGIVLTLLLVAAGWAMRRGEADLAHARTITHTAVENIGQGIIMVDAKGDIALLNQRAIALLDIPPQYGPGSRFTDLVAWQRRAGEFRAGTTEVLRARIYRASRPDRALPEVYKRQRPNGTWLEIRTIQLPDGASVRTFRDITDWEEAQAALVAARDTAEAAVRARAQFLAVMSHEIRTPLNGILGIAELLQDSAHDPEQARFVAVIRQSGQHLLDLLNDILDFSKIDQHAIELESLPFDPAQVLRDALALVEPRAAEQGLSLDCAIAPGLPPRVMGDAHRLRQVLLNLLGNAVKFTRQGGVTVRLDAARDGEAWQLRFAVRDTGIGMSAEVLPRLFQEFTQMDSTITRRFGGSGLGLAISRRLVEAMGGAIDAESTPGQGSEFRFAIHAPAAPAGLAEEEGSATAEAFLAARRPRVLLAEDNRVNRLVATRMAEKLGCRVDAVADGAAALAAIAQGRDDGGSDDGGYDIVLMDVMMPEMDGLAATRAIRALPCPAHRVKVIGLSANAFRSDETAALEAGMDGFVTKPVTLSQLAHAMARALADEQTDPTPPPLPTAMAALAETLGAETAALIAEAFVEEAPGQLARLRDLATTGDTAALAREAHAMAGSAGTVGLDPLATALRSMERALRQGAPADPAAIETIATLAQAGLQSLAPHRARHHAPVPAPRPAPALSA
jgi:signal transduction histidine kinase/DNA-binding response OmpR family regulator